MHSDYYQKVPKQNGSLDNSGSPHLFPAQLLDKHINVVGSDGRTYSPAPAP